ncbi:Ig-like and fibronectin type-III domain-containing protein 2 isoform X1 [Neodiprion pinetum]|uniref:Ig-like and fibronectin type-III domain-containing protein 2 isoform X1 n=1 Tax=Neodiprion pinetum TaxID=441929 RepID=UPI001EDE49F2|nr:Ig-like and fibronectin type-III domain-containing protein 1 isoform X1 [Neodiprion pinetum]XP_046473977.1 Ig-like and fibronectin type-III domain-containing protein 1 isoform X1 [Neodiprion pinetum]XP_046473988.1 Ig-like and fibronectin type-III domain-containing protein 1 isoform X1 [Neodiprion pinetum]XP_046473998.1 Ig-like and fibronectin type-III domain-containing protein 1 isoform X1 [Neodiprion pinetum]XP_046474009.1 Ig-like and fibronectin type-III domain-containing protein 1 isoform
MLQGNTNPINVLLIVLVTVASTLASTGMPSIRDSITHPVHVYEGDDALITCVVRNIGDNVVMWKKEDRPKHSRRILTAGDSRVTGDRRVSVIHDSATSGETEIPTGGDVWVLAIKNARPADSGLYVCEVNSDPVLRSFHKLSVLSRALLPPENATDVTLYSTQKEVYAKSHNYTTCCQSENVNASCLGFCSIQSILEGNTGQDPENCEADFPSIVKCMADGRNHVPCCIQESVPDICQDVCRGDYTVITENVKTHFSCSAYTEKTLACIVEGIKLLPSPPTLLNVESLTDKSLRVTWSPPDANRESVTEYLVNVTALRHFDEHPSDIDSTGTLPTENVTMLVKVRGNVLSTVVTDLKPFTMYEVRVVSLNIHGSSLPSYAVRTLTFSPGRMKPTTVVDTPRLPDTRGCCVSRGVTDPGCVEKLCDPSSIDHAEIHNLMICAPWAPDTFACLSDGIDHTPCCKARGLPDICQPFCSGNVTVINFNHFRCLSYMMVYKNCLLDGYGVLPSAPTSIQISNVDTDFAILQWSPPKTLGDTVKGYNVYYRELTDDYSTAIYEEHLDVYSPTILTNLTHDTDYEVYVEARNTHGVGDPSARIIFRTQSKVLVDKEEEASYYNITSCCVETNLNSICMPLCTYDASMSDIRALASVCDSDFHKILKCAAGGRNHNDCCSRRGVPAGCMTLCSGVIVDSLISTATSCIPFIGNIVQCLEEGVDTLPGPISELHATEITDSSVKLDWEPPTDGSNVTDYIVYYQKVDNTSMHETVSKLDHQINVTETSAAITGLENHKLYQMFVVSRNKYGTSLPTSVLMINITSIEIDDKGVHAVTSPPHSLAVSGHSATWVTISWQPPEFSHPSENLTYELLYKSTADQQFQHIQTSITSHRIQNLIPNTQYIVFVTAHGKKGTSLPSETLIAWTDPAYPAYVEPPTVHPINLVVEGSSMTILCIAMGTPMPTISLYISGRLVYQETTRHMVTVVNNVTRDMDQISCYADNGYGTPMQASRKISISHVPHVTASVITVAALGDSVVLECKVEAYPEPKMLFWRDKSGRIPVIQGGKYNIHVQPSKDTETEYVMQLTINKISEMDEGDYFCHAENAFGSGTQPVSVRIRNVAATNNVTQCCIEQNVTSGCMEACSFYLDIDAVIDKPQCINDFDKLMKCAADGSDHRSCCAKWDVPRRCLDWCRGEPLLNNKFCVLSYTRPIMSCFQEGRDRLPGPPQAISVDVLDPHTVNVHWTPPVKNPHTVEVYRVFWRPKGATKGNTTKNDTKTTNLVISGLKEGVIYECVVKAGNHLGTSTLSEQVEFITGDKYVTSALGDSGSHVGTVIGIILAVVFVACIVVAGVWFVRTKRLNAKGQGGVAFENPSYLREVNMDHIQDQSQVNGIATSVTSGGTGWKQETLNVPSGQMGSMASHETNTPYEELKLGQDGAGFKKLCP